jgi:hypothetical protein
LVGSLNFKRTTSSGFFLYIAEYKNRQFLFFEKKKPNSKIKEPLITVISKNIKEIGGFHERTGSSFTF